MKIRDIITKIANSEDVPNKIKWRNIIWIYNNEDQDYTNDDNDALLAYNFCNYTILGFINDEVEIIEKEKEIEKIPYHYNFGYIDCGDLKIEVVEELSRNFNYFADKINELIDAVNGIRKEK